MVNVKAEVVNEKEKAEVVNEKEKAESEASVNVVVGVKNIKSL